MCIHTFNVHICGHHTPNVDHNINSHCTKVQAQLHDYKRQPDIEDLVPGFQAWPIPPPRVCPVAPPVKDRLRPRRRWNGAESEANVRGWSQFRESLMRDFFQGSADPTQFGAIRQQASRREQPTHGDGGANMQLIEVPWGCGYGVGLCSAGLAGRRCPEKEAQREQNLVNALQADGLSGEEIDLALLEEERLRHLQDVRALEFGFDPAIPVVDDARMAARVIHWVSVDQGVFEKRPCSQLFGGALVIGVLDPVPEPAIQEPRRGRGRKKKSHGKGKGKGKARTESDISCH